MAERTEIAWCDSTFNPWIGCTKVSTAAGGGGGCDGCYAEVSTPARVLRAKGAETWGPGAPRQRTSPANWYLPIRWNAAQFAECMNCHWRGELKRETLVSRPPGFFPPIDSARPCPDCGGLQLKAARRRVFCASLADVFDNKVDPSWRADLFSLISDTPNLDWLLLTKRIGNAAGMIEKAIDFLAWGDPVRRSDLPLPPSWPWPNVWLGATVVNQAEADRDVPKLLATPAAVHFLSCEPLLGPIDLCFTARLVLKPSARPGSQKLWADWIIAGGESGPRARPAQRDWFRSLRDQCAAAGVPFLFKQWGEWAPGSNWPDDVAIPSGTCDRLEAHDNDRMWLVGKKAAGRLLDGVEHNGFPEIPR